MQYLRENKTMSAPVFSIIIPVYNGEKYLDRCLRSICDQTFQNYEALVVDDGSTDGTESICREYEKDNSQIKYIKKENGGVSSARNVGIANSEGEYLLFADADDYVERDYLSVFYGNTLKFGKETLLTCNMRKSCTMEPLSGSRTVEEYIVLIANDKIGGSVWNKLFSREIIIGNGLFFDEHISMCEDLLFCMDYMRYVKNGYIMEDVLYNYVNNPESVTKSNRLNLIDGIRVIERILRMPAVLDNETAAHFFISNRHSMCIRYLKAAIAAKCFDEKAGELKLSNSLSDHAGILFNRDIKIKYRLFYLYICFLCKIKKIRI